MMKFLEGKDRQQVEIYTQSLDETIGAENEVRLIDLFVCGLPFAELGFRIRGSIYSGIFTLERKPITTIYSFMLKRAFLSSLEAFRQQLILIGKTESQKLNRLRIKIFANFRHQFFDKPDFGGGY